MPNNVEELHVSLLKMREDLITAKVAQEVAQEKEETLRYEVTLLQEQMEQDSRVKELEISILKNEISGLRYKRCFFRPLTTGSRDSSNNISQGAAGEIREGSSIASRAGGEA